MSQQGNATASRLLSRVNCPSCGGRLYTGHQPGCPWAVAQKARVRRFVEMTRAARVAIKARRAQ